ncbi:MAG: HIRAN domain-containing protein [Candidatus Cryptobacteroides sp.]
MEEELPHDFEPELAGMPAPPDDRPLMGDISVIPPGLSGGDDDRLFLSCNVAGLQFRDTSEVLKELYEGAELALVRERGNKYDSNAVAVACPGDYDGDPDSFDFAFAIGYIPRDCNAALATMMDAGWEDIFTARVSEVKTHGPWSERLSIDIYVRDRDEKEPRKDVVRLMWANDDMMEDITGQLYDKGTVYLRWRNVPKVEHNLPSDGDKVVILHRSNVTLQAYLMKVLPEKCICDVRPDILDDLGRKDDCGPYLLSLIKGPVEVEDMSSLQFEEMEVCVRQPEIVAPEDILEQLHLDKEN